MSTLQLDKITKTFPNGSVAVSELDLDVADGEFCVIVGPSGCGKTTVLRAVAGLETLTSGDVLIDGVRVNDLSPQDRNIAMAFQQYALYPNMTVAENIGFPLRVAGVDKTTLAIEVDRIARMLGIADLLDRRPLKLSGGQQQRVAMARTLIRTPRLCLMDEPMSNLDSKRREEARHETLAMQRRIGTTTLYVTHDQVEAMAMGDHVVVMRDGIVVQDGTPRGIYSRPVDLFVAQFMGSPPMSAMRARVEPSERGLSIRIGHSTVQLDASTIARVPRLAELAGRTVVVGIRAESLERDPDGELVVSVEHSETLGNRQVVHATIEAEPAVTADAPPDPHAWIRLFAGPDEQFDRWQPLRLRPRTGELYFFDDLTGLAL